jgi:hypothetical protein
MSVTLVTVHKVLISSDLATSRLFTFPKPLQVVTYSTNSSLVSVSMVIPWGWSEVSPSSVSIRTGRFFKTLRGVSTCHLVRNCYVIKPCQSSIKSFQRGVKPPPANRPISIRYLTLTDCNMLHPAIRYGSAVAEKKQNFRNFYVFSGTIPHI